MKNFFYMVSVLLLELVGRPFCMEATAARAYQPYVKEFLINNTVDLSPVMAQKNLNFNNFLMSNPILVGPKYNEKDQLTFAYAAKNSIAVIPVQGAILKNDFCASIGTKTISRLTVEASTNPNIKGILYYIDSPGGAALGTAQCSTTIYNASKIIPTLSFCENVQCSAAEWIASSTRYNMANASDFSMIGSIGTYMTLQGSSPNDPVIHEIYATASTEKNADVKSALGGDYQPLLDNIINPLNDSFIAGMSRNRYGRGLDKAKVFTGATFQAKDALKYGLIDGIGTEQEAISKIIKMAA